MKFGSRDGLHYRSQEPNTADADFSGVEVIDYGFDQGTVETPQVVGEFYGGPDAQPRCPSGRPARVYGERSQ